MWSPLGVSRLNQPPTLPKPGQSLPLHVFRPRSRCIAFLGRAKPHRQYGGGRGCLDVTSESLSQLILRLEKYLYRCRFRFLRKATPYTMAASSTGSSVRPSGGSLQIIKAPAREEKTEGNRSIFFSGSINSSRDRDWQDELTESLAHSPVTIFNPRRVCFS